MTHITDGLTESDEEVLNEIIEKTNTVREMNHRQLVDYITKQEYIISRLKHQHNIDLGIKTKIEIAKREKQIKNEINKKSNIEHYLLTINPSEQCTLNDIQTILFLLKGKPHIKIKSYVIEQRGKTELEKGKGKHIHILMEKTKPKCRIIEKLNSTFQYHFKFPINIKIDTINKKEEQNVINYMHGNKSEEKQQCQQITKEWRKEVHLEDYYDNIDNTPIDKNVKIINLNKH